MNNWPVDDFDDFWMDDQSELEAKINEEFAKLHDGDDRTENYILAHLVWRNSLQRRRGVSRDIPDMDTVRAEWNRVKLKTGFYETLMDAHQGDLEIALVRIPEIRSEYCQGNLEWPYLEDVLFFSNLNATTTAALHFPKGAARNVWVYFTWFLNTGAVLDNQKHFAAGQISFDDAMTLYKYFCL